MAWTNHPCRPDMVYTISSQRITLIDWLGLPRVLCGWIWRLHQSSSSKVRSDLLTASAAGVEKVTVELMPTICLCYSRSSLLTRPPPSPFWRLHSDLTI